MFYNQHVFNQPIGNWDTHSLVDASDMFHNAHAFDQDLSVWNVQNLKYFHSFCTQCSSLNQNFGWAPCVADAGSLNTAFEGTPCESWDCGVSTCGATTDELATPYPAAGHAFISEDDAGADLSFGEAAGCYCDCELSECGHLALLGVDLGDAVMDSVFKQAVASIYFVDVSRVWVEASYNRRRRAQTGDTKVDYEVRWDDAGGKTASMSIVETQMSIDSAQAHFDAATASVPPASGRRAFDSANRPRTLRPPAGCSKDGSRRRRGRWLDLSRTSRGDAAASSWIVRGIAVPSSSPPASPPRRGGVETVKPSQVSRLHDDHGQLDRGRRFQHVDVSGLGAVFDVGAVDESRRHEVPAAGVEISISARRSPLALILAALGCGRRSRSNAGEANANARDLELSRRYPSVGDDDPPTTDDAGSPEWIGGLVVVVVVVLIAASIGFACYRRRQKKSKVAPAKLAAGAAVGAGATLASTETDVLGPMAGALTGLAAVAPPPLNMCLWPFTHALAELGLAARQVRFNKEDAGLLRRRGFEIAEKLDAVVGATSGLPVKRVRAISRTVDALSTALQDAAAFLSKFSKRGAFSKLCSGDIDSRQFQLLDKRLCELSTELGSALDLQQLALQTQKFDRIENLLQLLGSQTVDANNQAAAQRAAIMCGIQKGSSVEREELSELGLKLDKLTEGVGIVMSQNQQQQSSIDEVKALVSQKTQRVAGRDLARQDKARALEGLEVELDGVEAEPFARGAQGSVHMASYQGDDVALKKMSLTGVPLARRQKLMKDFATELAIMARPRRRRHDVEMRVLRYVPGRGVAASGRAASPAAAAPRRASDGPGPPPRGRCLGRFGSPAAGSPPRTSRVPGRGVAATASPAAALRASDATRPDRR